MKLSEGTTTQCYYNDEGTLFLVKGVFEIDISVPKIMLEKESKEDVTISLSDGIEEAHVDINGFLGNINVSGYTRFRDGVISIYSTNKNLAENNNSAIHISKEKTTPNSFDFKNYI